MKLFFSSNFFSNFYRWQGGKDDLESSFAWEEDGVTTLRSAVDCNKQKHTVLDCKKHKHTVLDCKKHNTITWCHSNTMAPTQSTAQQDPVSTMQKTGWIKSIKNSLNLLGKAMTNYKTSSQGDQKYRRGNSWPCFGGFFSLVLLFLNFDFHLLGDFACDQNIFPF